MNGFFRELRHGRVYRTAVSYAVVSWLVLQLAAIVSPALGLPMWTLGATIGVLLCGFTAVLWIGWLQDRRAPAGPGAEARAPRSRGHHLAFAAISLLPAAAVAVGWLVVSRRPGRAVPEGRALPTAAAVTEKSIAVLPFDNYSKDDDNAYFASAIQDEILTDLAQVADLKVISRTSVQAFGPGRARGINVRDIGRELGVAHVLEGSVQRAGNRVRVEAQLIDARTDAHLWAEKYDRDTADILAIQSELAERIATSLRARLSPVEKAAMDARPTADMAAYDLYLQAKELVAGYQQTPDGRETLLRATRLLDEATARDGNFALAYCLLAKAHDHLYTRAATPRRAGSRWRSARSRRRCGCNPARERRTSPARCIATTACAITRRRAASWPSPAPRCPTTRKSIPCSATWTGGRAPWEDALPEQERALSLDPRNVLVLTDQTVIYDMLRLYREEVRAAAAAIAAAPASADYFRMIEASALLSAGEVGAAEKELARVPASYDPDGATTYTRVCAALYGGHPDEAGRLVAAFQGENYDGINGLLTPRAWLEALVARAAGDPDGTRRALTRAREGAAADVAARPGDPGPLALLGQIDAGLGRRDEALAEGKRAAAMRPIFSDAMDGPALAGSLALIEAWTGEADEAMRGLEALAKTPGGPDYGQLRYDPAWETLRARPDFQAMVARLKPPPSILVAGR